MRILAPTDIARDLGWKQLNAEEKDETQRTLRKSWRARRVLSRESATGKAGIPETNHQDARGANLRPCICVNYEVVWLC
jgi:hypothetical protein